MQRRPKKTTSTKRRSRAAVARRKEKAGPVLVSAREKRIALDEAVNKRLESLEESVKNLWLMREQMNALSKELGDTRAEMNGLSEGLANNSQEEADNYMAIEALKQDLGDLRKSEAAWMNSEHGYSAQTRMMLEAESAKWRNAIGSLAANVHDKMEAMRRGE